MIPRDDIMSWLLQESLSGGSADIRFLVDLVDTIENQKFTINGSEEFLGSEGDSVEHALDVIKDIGGDVEINGVIYGLFDYVVIQLNETYSIQLEAGEHYEIYTNYLDSHLYPIEDGINDMDDKNFTKDEKKEVIKILEEFA